MTREQSVARSTGPAAELGSVLLVSCYELGHQPFAIASAWAALEHMGISVAAIDTSLDAIDDVELERARLIAISVPMHTALRLGVEVAHRARRVNPRAHVCAFGLYAWINAAYLLSEVLDSVIAGEFEATLAELARRVVDGASLTNLFGVSTRETLARGVVEPPLLERVQFQKPNRTALPALERYAKLLGPTLGEERTVGYVEASRGCKYRCRHCPVVPVYDGRFFVVPEGVVLADAEQQILAGARHLTFGDPDFFNGALHAMRVVRKLHADHPGVSFDVTIKIEHILRYRGFFPELAESGCLFVVSAVESLSDRVLAELDKGHTSSDVSEALSILRCSNLALRPSFVAFTPWTTLEDYLCLIDFVFEENLTEHVDPIQLAIRLLVPPRSALLWPTGKDVRRRPAGKRALESPAAAVENAPSWLGPLEPDRFSYEWRHPEPKMDELFLRVCGIVEQGAQSARSNADVLAEVREAAYEMVGRLAPHVSTARRVGFVPRLSEPWFCCAEPSGRQMDKLKSGESSQRSMPCATRSECSTASGEAPVAKMNPK